MPRFSARFSAYIFVLLSFISGLGLDLDDAFAQSAGSASNNSADTNDVDDWSVLAQKGTKELKAGDFVSAQSNYQKALNIAEKQQKIDPGVVTCLSSLALLNHKLGNFAESDRLYELAMRDLEGLYGPSSSQFVDWMPDLAWLYDQHGEAEKAEVLLKRVLRSRETTDGADNLSVAKILDTYVQFLRRHQRNSEASILEVRARSIRDKQSP